MTFKSFVKALGGNEVEGELLKTVITSLVTSIVVVGLLYFVKLRYVEDFIPKYGFWLFLAVLSIAITIPAVRQVRAYKKFPCMTGMMIGMTIGMMSGFLFGYFVGATNGMFWGAVFGMAVGMFLGIWNGKCCGIMGTMEGMMAGFMGGLMGAMTAVMMYNDHLKAAGIISYLICGAILVGLNYMVYTETRGFDRQHRDGEMLTIVLSFVLTIVTVWLMVYGPRSALFA